MPWIWREVSNPSANTVVVDIKGSRGENRAFNIHGIYIAHTSTTAKKYAVRTLLESSGEVAHFFTIVVPANSTFIIDSDEPLVAGIGVFAGWEHFQIVAVDGGEPKLSIGVRIKGRWYTVTDMRG